MTGSSTAEFAAGYAQAPLLRASLVVWCAYMLAAGALLALVPEFVVGVLGLAPVEDGWIRAFGALAFNIGLVYIPILRAPVQPALVAWTIYARYLFAAFTALAVLAGWFPPYFLLVGAFDALNATWTGLALRQARRTRPHGLTD